MKHERGIALVMALIILALMAALVVGFFALVRSGIFLERGEALSRRAFHLSDSGLDHARGILAARYAASQNYWDQYLDANGPVPIPLATNVDANGFLWIKTSRKDSSGYAVFMRDDDDGDGDLGRDNNRIVYLRSVGRVEKSGAVLSESRILALVRYIPPEDLYSQAKLGPSKRAGAEGEGPGSSNVRSRFRL